MSHEIAVRDMQIKDIHEYSQMLFGMVVEAPTNFSVTLDDARAYCYGELFNPGMQKAIKNNPAGRFVITALPQDTAVGMVIAKPRDNSLRISNMFIQAQYRGAGLGHALLDICESYALSEGIECTTLVVGSANKTAQRLYESHGYIEDDSVEHDAWHMHPGVYGITLKKILLGN